MGRKYTPYQIHKHIIMEGAGNATLTGHDTAGQDPKRLTREFCYRGDSLPTCLQITFCKNVWLVNTTKRYEVHCKTGFVL